MRERVPEPARQALRWTRLWQSPAPRRGYRIRTTYDKSLVALYDATPHRVPTGPFAGMRYISIAADCRSCGGALAPRLLGAYEAELQPGRRGGPGAVRPNGRGQRGSRPGPRRWFLHSRATARAPGRRAAFLLCDCERCELELIMCEYWDPAACRQFAVLRPKSTDT